MIAIARGSGLQGRCRRRSDLGFNRHRSERCLTVLWAFAQAPRPETSLPRFRFCWNSPRQLPL